MNDQAEPNPVLADLDFLAGEWDMQISNASFLSSRGATAHGHVIFEWIEGGALLVMRQAEKSGKPPSARWTIGRDESGTDYTVLYADTRGVSRVYRMSFAEGLWKLWRNSPNFSQRFEGHVNSDKRHHHLALGKLP